MKHIIVMRKRNNCLSQEEKRFSIGWGAFDWFTEREWKVEYIRYTPLKTIREDIVVSTIRPIKRLLDRKDRILEQLRSFE